MPLLTASNLRVSYADLDVFSDISLEIAERARIGIVGPNGGGKTSLLRVLVGAQDPNRGEVYHAARLRIGYVPQPTLVYLWGPPPHPRQGLRPSEPRSVAGRLPEYRLLPFPKRLPDHALG